PICESCSRVSVWWASRVDRPKDVRCLHRRCVAAAHVAALSSQSLIHWFRSRSTRSFITSLTIAYLVLVPAAARSQQPAGIRGFTSANAAAERDLEKRLQAVPSAENLREYMRTIAAE